MAPGDSNHVDDEQSSPEPRQITQLELVVALYQQGRSAIEIRDLMEIPLHTVKDLVYAAGVARMPQEAAHLANRRGAARSKIARLDIHALAARWIEGDEPEKIADELGVLADLLWDALAAQLSKKNPTEPPTQKLTCVQECTYGCMKQCALNLPLAPRTPTTKQGSRPGIPYAKLGLSLPAPGPRDRWGP